MGQTSDNDERSDDHDVHVKYRGCTVAMIIAKCSNSTMAALPSIWRHDAKLLSFRKKDESKRRTVAQIAACRGDVKYLQELPACWQYPENPLDCYSVWNLFRKEHIRSAGPLDITDSAILLECGRLEALAQNNWISHWMPGQVKSELDKRMVLSYPQLM